MKFQQFMKKSLLIALYREYHLWVSALTQELKVFDLNLNDSLILLAIFFENNNEIQPSQLSTTLDIPKDQISQSLKRLEQIGLIVRKTFKSDARKRKISISSLGKKRASELIKVYDRMENRYEDHSKKNQN